MNYDILFEVALYSHIHSLSRFFLVCKSWNELYKDDFLWFKKGQRDFEWNDNVLEYKISNLNKYKIAFLRNARIYCKLINYGSAHGLNFLCNYVSIDYWILKSDFTCSFKTQHKDIVLVLLKHSKNNILNDVYRDVLSFFYEDIEHLKFTKDILKANNIRIDTSYLSFILLPLVLKTENFELIKFVHSTIRELNNFTSHTLNSILDHYKDRVESLRQLIPYLDLSPEEHFLIIEYAALKNLDGYIVSLEILHSKYVSEGLDIKPLMDNVLSEVSHHNNRKILQDIIRIFGTGSMFHIELKQYHYNFNSYCYYNTTIEYLFDETEITFGPGVSYEIVKYYTDKSDIRFLTNPRLNLTQPIRTLFWMIKTDQRHLIYDLILHPSFDSDIPYVSSKILSTIITMNDIKLLNLLVNLDTHKYDRRINHEDCSDLIYRCKGNVDILNCLLEIPDVEITLNHLIYHNDDTNTFPILFDRSKLTRKDLNKLIFEIYHDPRKAEMCENLIYILRHRKLESYIINVYVLEILFKCGKWDILKRLFRNPEVNPGFRGGKYFIKMCVTGDFECIKNIINHPNLALRRIINHSIHEALKHKHYELAFFLINHERCVNYIKNYKLITFIFVRRFYNDLEREQPELTEALFKDERFKDI